MKKLGFIYSVFIQGYPGKLDVTVQYILNGDKLTIDYSAVSDKDTVVNLTNHAYFNLDGHKAWGKLDNHSIQLNALAYTPVDGDAIPIGEMRNVSGSAFDLTSSGKNIRLGILITFALISSTHSSKPCSS